MIASDAPAPGGAARRSRPRRRLLVLLLAAAVVGLGSGGAALAVRLAAAPRGASVVLEATVPAAEKGDPALSDVVLVGSGGSVALSGSAPAAVVHAPLLTDLGVHGVSGGDYTTVSATVGGRRLTARLALTLRGGGVTPLLLVVRPGGITAAAGNDDVNHAALVAAGQILHPPDVTFVDQAGQSVPLHGLRGKVLVVAALDAHCHETCPLYTALWADLQRVIRERGWQDRVALAEVSMDPERDTPQELAAYGRMAGATWPLLRSDPESTLSFWLSLNATYHKSPAASPAPIDWYTGQPETYHLDHDSLAVVFDQNGDARYLLQGNPQLGHALSPALAGLLAGGHGGAATPGKVGSWSLVDLLDRVDVVLGAPPESTRGVEAAAREGSRAPEIALAGLDGKRVSLMHDEAGRPVVVTFWATWCTPCRRDLPLLAAAVLGHPGLVVLAVDEGESSGQVRDYLHSVLGADASLLTTVLDPDKAAGARYGVGGMPSTVFVGADGVVQSVRTGELHGDDLTTALARTGA